MEWYELQRNLGAAPAYRMYDHFVYIIKSLIGQFFILDENDKTIIVISKNNGRMIGEFSFQKLKKHTRGTCCSNAIYIATIRTSGTFLLEQFPQHLISLRSDLEWPARSPDFLILCYFKETTQTLAVIVIVWKRYVCGDKYAILERQEPPRTSWGYRM